jgi:hypothetical protein
VIDYVPGCRRAAHGAQAICGRGRRDGVATHRATRGGS